VFASFEHAGRTDLPMGKDSFAKSRQLDQPREATVRLIR
jgi:hypothetical protein